MEYVSKSNRVVSSLLYVIVAILVEVGETLIWDAKLAKKYFRYKKFASLDDELASMMKTMSNLQS